MADDAETEDQDAKKPSLIKKLMIPVLLVAVSAGGTFGGLKFSGMLAEPEPKEAEGEMAEGEESEEMAANSQVGKPAFFFTLYPDLLVNFQADGRSAYLKLAIDVMSHDEEVIQGVEAYQAIVRNNLLSAFQNINFNTAERQAGIESMRTLAMEEIKTVLTQYHGKSAVEGVYFTSFVLQ